MTTQQDSLHRYRPTAQLLHWVSVLLVGFAWGSGMIGDDLPKGSIRNLGEFLHVCAGQLVFGLLALRLAWRWMSPPPPAEATPLGPWAERSGRAMHVLLYGLLAAVPIAGVVTLFAGGEGVPLFGLGEIPSPWIKDKAFEHNVEEIHETLAHALIVLATLHAGAALVHHYYLRDRTLTRILPRIFERQA